MCESALTRAHWDDRLSLDGGVQNTFCIIIIRLPAIAAGHATRAEAPANWCVRVCVRIE